FGSCSAKALFSWRMAPDEIIETVETGRRRQVRGTFALSCWRQIGVGGSGVIAINLKEGFDEAGNHGAMGRSVWRFAAATTCFWGGSGRHNLVWRPHPDDRR